jgi:trimethylamine--corrinoid protein Co-methyltransferase
MTQDILMMRHFIRGVSLDAEALALDVIHKVGPGGDFLAQKHTAKHFREHWQPQLFNRQRMDDWVQSGKKRLGDRLRDKTITLVDSHRPEPLPANAEAEIGYILKRK